VDGPLLEEAVAFVAVEGDRFADALPLVAGAFLSLPTPVGSRAPSDVARRLAQFAAANPEAIEVALAFNQNSIAAARQNIEALLA
jgi:hypothetical protein